MYCVLLNVLGVFDLSFTGKTTVSVFFSMKKNAVSVHVVESWLLTQFSFGDLHKCSVLSVT